MSRLHFAAAMLLASTLAAPPDTHAQSICGTRTHRPRRYEHVVWIWMENHNYGHVVGSPNAPYINGLIAECGLATNFHNLTHVSLPNYIGAVTGLGLSELQPFLMDCNPGGSCLTDANSLFAQVASWKAYMESMTTNCQMVGFAPYAVRHNPPPYLTSLGGCDTFDVPYPELQADLDAWLVEYNERRPHQGRWCFGKTPMQTFLDSVPLAKEKLLVA